MAGQLLVPREYESRILSTDVLAVSGFSEAATLIYLVVGWQAGFDISYVHMIELRGETTPTQIAAELAKTRRCYCTQCLDPEIHSVKDGSVVLVEALNVRKVIADANKIETNGHPDNEAQIDQLLEEATR